MQSQSYKLEGLAHTMLILTSNNSSVISQFAQMTVIINAMEPQLKT